MNNELTFTTVEPYLCPKDANRIADLFRDVKDINVSVQFFINGDELVEYKTTFTRSGNLAGLVMQVSRMLRRGQRRMGSAEITFKEV